MSAEDPKELKRFAERLRNSIAEDRDGAPVLLAASQWELNRTMRDWPEVTFMKAGERA